MSRKNYIAIAEIVSIADFGDPADWQTADRRLTLAQSLAEYFQSENVHFDRARFIAACMGKSR
jgi:hypothetical protein